MGNLTTVLPVSYSTISGEYTEITNAHSVSYEYNSNNLLSSVVTESTRYNFTYDAFGNSTAVAVGNNQIANYEYYSNNGKLKKVTYANGFAVSYLYNTLEKISEVWYHYSNGSEELAYSYEYTANGVVYKEADHILDRETVYKYDERDRLQVVANYDSGNNVHEVLYSYDEKSRLDDIYQRIDYLANGTTQVAPIHNSITYNADNRIGEERIESDQHKTTLYYEYDNFGRVTLYEAYSGNGAGLSTAKIITSYEYREFGTSQTDSLITKATTTVNGAVSEIYDIEYDNRGYITKITYKDGTSVVYTYDDIGQLVREDNSIFGETYVYTYDNAGNILEKVVYPLIYGAAQCMPISSVQYVYGNSEWGDMLTSFNGQSITYDSIGNPLQYRDGLSFTWCGRQMASATRGTNTYTFEYNKDGLRAIKENPDGTSTYYYYHNGMLIAEETAGEMLMYHYSSGGSIIGMSYRNASYAEGVFDTYVFEKNILGDIVAVYDINGVKLVSCRYDAWGNFTTMYHNGTTSNSIAARNPFKYRGYYYDKDLGLYYLQTRYYDSVTGRFINAGEISQSTNGIILNLYCYGNPIPKGTVCIKSIETGIKPKEKILKKKYVEYIPGVPNAPATPDSSKQETIVKPDFLIHFENKGDHVYLQLRFSGPYADIEIYTDKTIEFVMQEYSEFFGESVIDRHQLYGEILFHFWVYVTFGDAIDRANPADIDIYWDGSVKDDDEWINVVSKMFGYVPW